MFYRTMTIKEVNILVDSINIKNEKDVLYVLNLIGHEKQAVQFCKIRNIYPSIYDALIGTIRGSYPKNTDVLFGYIGKQNGSKLKYDSQHKRTGSVQEILQIKNIQELRCLQGKIGITDSTTFEEALNRYFLKYCNIDRSIKNQYACKTIIQEMMKALQYSHRK